MKAVKHLYIHIPFCRQRCAYCDFYSETGQLRQAPLLTEALLAELEAANLPAGCLQTVYIGGGTPVLLGPALLERLLTAVMAHAHQAAEVTVEANPRFIDQAMASCLREAGATRVSLGAQSFDRRMRKRLGRAGAPATIAAAVELLRQAGHRNINLDMIYAIPGQTPAGLKSDLAAVLALQPEHISYYGLTVKPDSDYRRRWQKEFEALEAADYGRLFYETVASSLEAAGYRWYETSNFSRPGFECRHNMGYWTGADYVGLGPGAWSTVGLERWRNAEDIPGYVTGTGAQAHSHAASGSDASGSDASGSAVQESHGPGPAAANPVSQPAGRRRERLTPDDRLREKLMLGLRLDEGVRHAEVAPVVDSGAQNNLQRNGFLAIEGDKMFLTRTGRFVANEVCVRLMKA